MENIKQQTSEGGTMQKKRGKLLTFLLSTNFILVLWGLGTSLNLNVLSQTYPSSWVQIEVIVSYFVSIIALVGIFFWKRWGAYLFFIQGILGFIFYEILLRPYITKNSSYEIFNRYSFIIWFIILIWLLIWFIAIKKKWHFFN